MKLGSNPIERLIIAAALGISVVIVVTVVAMSRHRNAQLQARFATVMTATENFKMAIELCAKFGPCAKSGALSGLEDGTLGIPYSHSDTYLASVRVAANGTITATATNAEGLAGETYVLTPSYVKGAPITWAVSGTCKTRPAGAIC